MRCTCTPLKACDADHAVRVESLTHPDLVALRGQRAGSPMMAVRRYRPDGSPLAEALILGGERHEREVTP